MSATYIGIIVGLLSALMPKLGVEIGNDALTTTLSVIFSIVGALWAMYGRWRLGGVNVAGMRQ